MYDFFCFGGYKWKGKLLRLEAGNLLHCIRSKVLSSISDVYDICSYAQFYLNHKLNIIHHTFLQLLARTPVLPKPPRATFPFMPFVPTLAL